MSVSGVKGIQGAHQDPGVLQPVDDVSRREGGPSSRDNFSRSSAADRFRVTARPWVAPTSDGATEIGSVALAQLSAMRPEAAVLVEAAGQTFACTYFVDADWELHFTLWPQGSSDDAVSFKASDLVTGVTYTSPSGPIHIREEGGRITLKPAEGAETSRGSVTIDELSGALYERSLRMTFGELVTYAVMRNDDPTSGQQGVMLLRRDDSGMYFLSLTPDQAMSDELKWIVGVNGVLYGMKTVGGRLVFVSKPVSPEALLGEKSLR